MLTGFDSKWVNTLYMDKMLEYENIIQAFSRTNRLFGPDKPFGVIRYYRKAVNKQSNRTVAGVQLHRFQHILLHCVPDFEKLPQDRSVCAKFASCSASLTTTWRQHVCRALHGIKAYIIARTTLPMKPLMSKCCSYSWNQSHRCRFPSNSPPNHTAHRRHRENP